MSSSNKNIVLIMGKPNSGKSTSLRNIPNQNEFVYLNTDLKELPFKAAFLQNVEVKDAMDILTYIEEIENEEGVKGAILDTLTFLMATYERQYVNTSANTQKAWGDYGIFYRNFIHVIKAGTKDYAILAHEDTIHNDQDMTLETKVPLKGSVGKTGVEADFTTVLSAKQVSLKKLEGFENDLLHITDEEQEDGFKYVFVTRINKQYLGEKIKSPLGLWKRNELYIDNDLNQVFKRLKEYYG